MNPITLFPSDTARDIRFVLMDIDDTLTTKGHVPATAYDALWRLHDAGLITVPVTGRPAGWCDLIARQWPVDGVIGENGALAFWEEGSHLHRIYHKNAVPNDNSVLHEIERRVLREIPGSRIAGDQFYRMFDLAIDFAEEKPYLSRRDAERIRDICTEEGAHAKISSIHVNAWMGRYDKLDMAKRFLRERFLYDDDTMKREVLFFGDSPNDEPMFGHFPVCVGVAGILKFGPCFPCLPQFVTSEAGGAGFAEGVDAFLGRRAAAAQEPEAVR